MSKHSQLRLNTIISALFWTVMNESGRPRTDIIKEISDKTGRPIEEIEEFLSQKPSWTIEAVADFAEALGLDLCIRAKEADGKAYMSSWDGNA
jgi:hypothetical protein